MQYSEAKQGRVFIIRLDGGEKIPDVLEEFARNQGIERAYCFLVGGIDDGSRIIVGPERAIPKGRPVPIEYELEGVHEVLGTGTLFPDEEGNPVLHMHVAAGRKGKTSTGCSRAGIEVWNIGEVVFIELLAGRGKRVFEESSGFKKLEM
jgi:predicted DNA-binding protein with PD1-like motif